MKKIAFSILFISILISCTKEKTGDMLVKGTIKGLEKGTLYLQKMEEKKLITLDSINVFGNENFQLVAPIESSEVFYLSLDKNDAKRIPFFGEKGTITIHTKLDKFTTAAKIGGSKNQELLEEYIKVKQRFNNKNLELIKAQFEAKRDQKKEVLASLDQAAKRQTRRRYLYTINFAVNHADSEIAPYLAITELYNAQVKWLDSINNSLTKEVKASKYGKDLAKFITDIKTLKPANEKSN